MKLRPLSALPLLLLAGCGRLSSDPEADSPEMTGEISQAMMATWTPLSNPAPGFLNNCMLLTNGDVMCHEYDTNRWHRLRPDINGSYANGSWDSPPIATMPNGRDAAVPGCSVSCTYAPRFFSSALLPDGRVVVIGGEFLNGAQVWTNIGFIYDPVANSWSAQLNEQFGSSHVGDASGIVLANGTYVLSNIDTGDLESLNPSTLTFTKLNATGKADRNNEENWNILYDGSIITVDSAIAAQSERYSPVTNTWGDRLSTVVNMADTAGLGNTAEIGPAVLRPNGTMVAFSANSLGQNAVYDSTANSWSHFSNMDFPLVPGQNYHFAVADGSCALLPNGSVLVAASPVANGNPFQFGTHFYEIDLPTNTLVPVTDMASAASFKAYQIHMLELPTGQLLVNGYDQASVQAVALYSNGGAPDNSWRPAITSVPTTLVPGTTYTLAGRLLNGFSEGAQYGDDFQMSTNYPLVRIKNLASGHVFYARTHDHSRMGVERVGSTEVQTTRFDVPPGLEAGPSSLSVVVNGIESQPTRVNDPCASNALAISGAVASSQESASFPASNAADGNLATRWSSAFSDPQWIRIDLGAQRFVGRLKITWESAASSDYDIQASNDGTNFTAVYTDPQGNGGVDDVTLSVVARYLRVYSRHRTTPYGISIFELEPFGDTNTACNPPPSCTDGIQNGSETGVDCGGTCGACLGAQVFVKSDWGSGYCVDLRITNTRAQPTTNWNVTVDLHGSVTYTTWNGIFSGTSGNITVAPAASWNRVVAPGATDSTVGFCANRPPGAGTAQLTSASATY